MELGQCERLRNVDKLIDYYLGIRDQALEVLTKFPDNLVSNLWGKYITIDKTCSSKMGINPKSQMACFNCTCLSRLTESLVNGEISIEYGKRIGKKLKISTRVGNRYAVSVDRKQGAYIKNTQDQTPLLKTCGTKSFNGQVLKVDPVSAEILITWCYNQIDKYSPQLITAFQCRDHVYLLQEESFPLSEVIDNITISTAKSIVLQLTSLFKKLSLYSFTHGYSGPQQVTIAKKPISYMFDGVHIDGEYKANLEMGGYSCITIGQTRITPSAHLQNYTSKPKIVKSFDSTITIYTVEKDTFQSFKAMRRSGVELYPGSFDFYCMVIGLMTCPIFRTAINDLLGDVWSLMWIGNGDLELIETRLSNYTGFLSHEEIVTNILSGIWLRCDVLDLVWNHLK